MTAATSVPAPPLVLGSVTVIDPRDGSVTANRDVHIADGTITAVTEPSEAAPGRVDLSGRYLVPGFVDMHSHALNSPKPAGALALMLANGITGFRQMNGSLAQLGERRAGTLDLPQDSPALMALTGDLLTPGNAGTPARAVAAVKAGHAAGSDFIKIAAVSPAAFLAAQAEAERLGIRIGGHLPAAIDPTVSAAAGLWSVEHVGPGIVLLVACSTDEQALRDALAGLPEIRVPPITLPFMDRIVGEVLRRLIVNPLRRQTRAASSRLRHAIDTFDEDKAHGLAAMFAASGTWHVPTLIRQLTTEKADLPQLRSSPGLRFVAESTVRSWNRASDTFARLPSETRDTFHREYDMELRLVKIFDEEGVSMAAGTDATGAGWVVPGVALHQEFDELEKAGLSPLRILQLTTWAAAQMLGTTDTMGTIEPGKLADLVVLDADPVDSLQGLHSVSGVVRAGRFLSTEHLHRLRESVASARSVDQ